MAKRNNNRNNNKNKNRNNNRPAASAPRRSGGGNANRGGGGNRGGNKNLSIKNRGQQSRAPQQTQTQRAPYPEAFRNNPTAAANAQYIPELMVKGNESLGYRPEYNGDGWAAAPGGVEVDKLKDFYKAMAATGNAAIGYGSWDQIRAAAGQYDPSQFGDSSSSSGGGGKSNTARMNYNAAMADGKIGRREIEAYMDQKGIKGKDRANAQMRIANRWSQKGGALGRGVAKDYTENYAKKNPYDAAYNGMVGKQMRIGSSGMMRTIEAPKNDMSSRRGQKGALYRGLTGFLNDKNYAKGDVFSTLKNGDVRAGKALPTSYSPAGNLGDAQGAGTGGAGAGGYDDFPMEDYYSEESSSSGMTGGLGSLTGENNLGFKRKQSSMASSGRNRKGTSIAARSGFKSGLSIK